MWYRDAAGISELVGGGCLRSSSRFAGSGAISPRHPTSTTAPTIRQPLPSPAFHTRASSVTLPPKLVATRICCLRSPRQLRWAENLPSVAYVPRPRPLFPPRRSSPPDLPVHAPSQTPWATDAQYSKQPQIPNGARPLVSSPRHASLAAIQFSVHSKISPTCPALDPPAASE